MKNGILKNKSGLYKTAKAFLHEMMPYFVSFSNTGFQ